MEINNINNKIDINDSSSFVNLYLFDQQGNFYWCNGSSNISIENQGMLHSGLFATLYKISIETLGEKLKDLMINELRINIFSILKKYLVAIVTPKYLKIDPRKINSIEHNIKTSIKEMSELSDIEIIDLIIKNLNKLVDQLLDWLNTYSYQSEIAVSIFTKHIAEIEKYQVAVFLYTWDWNRVFKYIPLNIDLNFKIEEVIDTMIKKIEDLPNINRTHLLMDDTLIYFIIKDIILVLARTIPSNKKTGRSIDEAYQEIISVSQPLSDLLDEIIRMANLKSDVEGKE